MALSHRLAKAKFKNDWVALEKWYRTEKAAREKYKSIAPGAPRKREKKSADHDESLSWAQQGDGSARSSLVGTKEQKTLDVFDFPTPDPVADLRTVRVREAGGGVCWWGTLKIYPTEEEAEGGRVERIAGIARSASGVSPGCWVNNARTCKDIIAEYTARRFKKNIDNSITQRKLSHVYFLSHTSMPTKSPKFSKNAGLQSFFLLGKKSTTNVPYPPILTRWLSPASQATS